MANYQHSGWRAEPTPAARLAKLRLFIGELEEQTVQDKSIDGASVSSGTIAGRIERLDEERRRLEAIVSRSGGRGVRVPRRNRIGP